MKNNNTKRDVIRQYLLSECQDYCFIVLETFLALTTAQAKNNAIALAITLIGTS